MQAFLSVVASIFAWIYRAVVICALWNWYFVELGLPPADIVTTAGLSMAIDVAIFDARAPRMKLPWYIVLRARMVVLSVALLLGWLLHFGL